MDVDKRRKRLRKQKEEEDITDIQPVTGSPDALGDDEKDDTVPRYTHKKQKDRQRDRTDTA